MPNSDRAVTVTAQARTNIDPQRAFDIVTPIDLPTAIRRTGPLPGVAEVREQTGAWDATGQTRLIVLSDRSSMRETLVEYEAGHRFAYQLSELTGLLGLLATGVRGEWEFTPDGPGTIIRWSWKISPKPGRDPVVRFVVAPLLRRHMSAGCRRAAEACDRS